MSMDQALRSAHHRQLARLAELEARGETVGGWKIGQTSGESRDAFGPGVRAFGHLLASRIFDSGVRLDWNSIVKGGLENEVCFVFGRDVTAPVTAASVRDALAGVAPAFEINERRIERSAPVPERIADNLANWGIVVGEWVPVPADWDWEALVVTTQHGAETVAEVAAAGHIDDHFESLALLANQLLDFDRHIRAGDRVITGAFGRDADPAPGTWVGDFGEDLGRVSLVVTR